MIKFSEAERIYKRGYQYKRREPDHIFLRQDLDDMWWLHWKVYLELSEFLGSDIVFWGVGGFGLLTMI